MKICSSCKQPKDLLDYAKQTRSHDGLQSRCRDCAKIAYQSDRQKQIARVAERNKIHRKLMKEYVWSLKSEPCVDCGTRYHPFQMDYDHVRGVKHRDLNLLLKSAASKKMIDTEIAKCDLVCANCHRLRTWQRTQMPL